MARQLGSSDGRMPMHAGIPGDYVPCDDCARDNILVVETDPPKNGGDTVRKIKPAGVCVLVPRKVVSRLIKDDAKREAVMARGAMCVDHDTAEWLGMHKEPDNA